MTLDQFIDQLRSLKFDCTFNPYSETCKEFDLQNAPQLRCRQLLKIARQAQACELEALWIGRDLGYRGGRRTGLAFTDDLHLHAHADRWDIELSRPTRGEIVGERTATVLWNALSQIKQPVFLWNVFPLHPFQEDNSYSNRSHNAKERASGTELLVELIDLLQPKKLLPIGKDAARVANLISGEREVLAVRHPSYGGQREFLEQMARYNCTAHA